MLEGFEVLSNNILLLSADVYRDYPDNSSLIIRQLVDYSIIKCNTKPKGIDDHVLGRVKLGFCSQVEKRGVLKTQYWFTLCAAAIVWLCPALSI